MMIRIRLYMYYVAVCALLFWSCNPESNTVFPEEMDKEIIPTCGVYTSDVEPLTRGEGVKDFGSTITARIFRADYSGSWPAVSSALVNKSATVNSSTNTVTFTEDDKLYYQVNGNDTKLLGIYPYNYTSMPGSEVIYPVDGYTDIMATPWSNAANKKSTIHPALTFKHMLSQLIVTIKGEDATAIGMWGKVTKVTVNGVSNSCRVALPASSSGTMTAPTVAPNGTGTADFQVRTASGAVPGAFTMTTSAVTYGYCMIVPFTISTSKPLNLTVYTENGPAAGQPVTLTKTLSMVSGKAYIIQLYMSKQAIEPMASIGKWNDGTGITETL